jgi:hypothetical protein
MVRIRQSISSRSVLANSNLSIRFVLSKYGCGAREPAVQSICRQTLDRFKIEAFVINYPVVVWSDV